MILSRELARSQHGMVLMWEDFGPDDELSAATMADFSPMTVTVDGGAAQLLGRNDPEGTWWPLTDVHGFLIKAPGIYLVTLNPWQVKPHATTETRTTVAICAMRT